MCACFLCALQNSCAVAAVFRCVVGGCLVLHRGTWCCGGAWGGSDGASYRVWTLLHEAVANNDLMGVKRLLQGIADPNLQAPGGLTALHLAARYGFLAIAEELIKYGAKMGFQSDYYHYRPLHLATEYGL